MSDIKVFKTTTDLNPLWDSLTDSYFQTLEFLCYVEKYKPCEQKYFEIYYDDKLSACAILYSIRLDLLTFLRLKSPMKMNIVGVPCSVSSSGIFGNQDAVNQLKKHIYQNGKGFTLFLNLDKLTDNQEVAKGETLPAIIFENRFKSFDDYYSNLRSDYRRRIKKITANKMLH